MICFWLKFNWAHVNWSTSHEPTKILCTFLNWNLSSFSLFFFSPLISFVYFDFYLTSPLELIAHIFLLSLKCGAVIVFKCTDTWGVTIPQVHRRLVGWAGATEPPAPSSPASSWLHRATGVSICKRDFATPQVSVHLNTINVP